MRNLRREYNLYDLIVKSSFIIWILLVIRATVPVITKNDASAIFAAGFVAQSSALSVHDHRTKNYRVYSTKTMNKPNQMTVASRKATNSRVVQIFSSGTDSSNEDSSPNNLLSLITKDPRRSILFSILMSICGAGLGPFLDSYHSAFGVLKYDEPIRLILWGSETYPALTTTWWVPELFGLAGFLIGWLYILLDALYFENSDDDRQRPSPPKILVGISFFTLQYWLSGICVQTGLLDRSQILNLMSVFAAIGFFVLDGTFSGLIVSLATCLGGPLIEAGLITATTNGILNSGYHYNDLGETGFFPLWIIPVYFLGGPANGNLARGFWNVLSNKNENNEKTRAKKAVKKKCSECQDTRRTMCPNCDGIGTYVAMGNRTVRCTSCNARGFVICRSCFDQYDDDPYDIDGIREIMNRMPD